MPNAESEIPAFPAQGSKPTRKSLIALGTVAGLSMLIMGLIEWNLRISPTFADEKSGLADMKPQLFRSWPKADPDVVLVITGQTLGYMQKCGCSNPQKGGLERRYNFIEMLRTQKNWDVVALDLGDLAPEQSKHSDIYKPQALKKYLFTMHSLKAMKYAAVGLGVEELYLPLTGAMDAFSLQPGNDRPEVVATNLKSYDGKPTAEQFPSAVGTGSTIKEWSISDSKVPVGVVSVMGKEMLPEVAKADKQAVFDLPNAPKLVRDALAAMAKQKKPPQIQTLLYEGPLDDAKKIAEAFPQFDVIVCQSPESEPPAQPTIVQVKGKSVMIVQVGHKGQNLGVVGAYRNAKGQFDLYYDRVPVTEAYDTPAGKEKDNKALQELEKYARAVKEENYLELFPKTKHQLQIANGGVHFVGSESCKACHAKEYEIWANAKHAQAYKTLQAAKKPSLREFDPECIICHTTGYRFKTGYADPGVPQNQWPKFEGVGCESCHGPASAHVGAPFNKAFALELSPWKIGGQGQMPSVEKMEAYAKEKDPAKQQKILTEAEYRIMRRIDSGIPGNSQSFSCQKCHDPENDPHFRLEDFWPKIAHSGFPRVGAPAAKQPAVPPGK